MYCPIILGSDKTTVSVATGQVEYHPLYLSIGNPHNTVRRAHRNAVVPIAFLAIPKGRLHQKYVQKANNRFPGDRDSDDNTGFRVFKHQTVPRFCEGCSTYTASRHGNACSPSMSQWTFQTCDLRPCHIHC